METAVTQFVSVCISEGRGEGKPACQVNSVVDLDISGDFDDKASKFETSDPNSKSNCACKKSDLSFGIHPS